MQRSVGVIGLGIMGSAMARNLHAAGWRVLGFDTDAGRRDALAAGGVTIAADAVAVAREAEVLITSLPSAAALAATAAGIAASGLARRVVVETSTLALADKLEAERVLAAGGHVALDCPISGTGSQAVLRDLVFYASGDSAAIAAVRPLLLDLGRAVHDLGAYGNGSRMKYVANLLVAINNVASAEAMVLGMKAGLDPHQLVELVCSGAAGSRVFELRAPMMADAVYAPATMKVSIWAKDMAVIGQYATELGCPTPLFSATQPIYAAAAAQGLGPQDTASVCTVLEGMAGITR
jgi:3-hydroxyisobutyrate dehydrogenase-like beta-hydroxyacid dehydrogenase